MDWLAQLNGLVDAGNTVIVIEHEMRVVAGSDWVVDVGPGAGDEGGRVVAAGTPGEVAKAIKSRTTPGPAEPIGGRASRGGSASSRVRPFGTAMLKPFNRHGAGHPA